MKFFSLRCSFSHFVREARGLSFVKGLMFSRSTHSPLLFSFPVPLAIHSLFVFYPFLAVWMTKENRILRVDVVKPFCFHVSPPSRARRLLEVPLHVRYSSFGTFLVGKTRFQALLSSRRTNI